MSWDDWTLRNRHQDAAVDADQVECEAILLGNAAVDVGIRDEIMAGVVDDNIIEPGNSWQERQETLEEFSGAIADEIARRAEIMGEAYPFKLESNGIVYTQSRTGVYEFCLAVAMNPTGAKEGYKRASAIFEYIARDVLITHIGGGTGFRTGHPAYDSENRGTKASETFTALEALCGEFHWSPEEGKPADPSYIHLKDGGLDVVVWKSIEQLEYKRKGNFFILGQCACGKNDINQNKAKELSIERLATWLRPVTHAGPLRTFLLAHHVPNAAYLHDLSKYGGVVYDRARITILAESSPERFCGPDIDYHGDAMRYLPQS